MRRLVLCCVLGAAAAAFAQLPPPKLEPLAEPPPPPPGVRDIGADEPRVRIAPQEGDQVEEIRDGGRVIMLKVTPPGGAPYYLIDPSGSGNWLRRDTLDDGVRVPQWPIFTFD